MLGVAPKPSVADFQVSIRDISVETQKRSLLLCKFVLHPSPTYLLGAKVYLSRGTSRNQISIIHSEGFRFLFRKRYRV